MARTEVTTEAGPARLGGRRRRGALATVASAVAAVATFGAAGATVPGDGEDDVLGVVAVVVR